MTTPVRRTVSRRQNGTEILRATFSAPPDAPALVNDLISAAENYVDTTLHAKALAAFDADPDPGKRFTFRRFEYDLAVALTPESPDIAALTITAALARARGGAPTRRHLTYRLRLSDGTLLPPPKTKKAPKGAPSPQ